MKGKKCSITSGMSSEIVKKHLKEGESAFGRGKMVTLSRFVTNMMQSTMTQQ